MLLTTEPPIMLLDEILLSLDRADADETAVDEFRQADRYAMAEARDEQLADLLAALVQRAPFSKRQEWRLGSLYQAMLEREWETSGAATARLPAAIPPLLASLYRASGGASATRAMLLQLLATRGDAELAVLADLLVTDPPLDLRGMLLAMAPLFRRRDFDPAHLFPRLLDGLSHPRLAASIVDLSNYVTQTELCDAHPASDRATRMIGLLGELTQRLGQMEEAVGQQPGSAAQLAASVEDSVALAVALCRALALMRADAAVGKLYQTLDLRHRRLRAEAAAALAAFGEEAGRDALAELAEEPVVRQRVLAYAEELGCLDRIDSQYQTFEARAEAELACWLAQPAQVGIPPNRLEIVDHRQLHWPGYDDEIECCLIRYSYQFAEGAFSNIGIVGPLTHAFSADLGDLPPDDIYAAFAGWQAEHEEIYEQDFVTLTEAQRVDVARLERRMRDFGYDAIHPLRLGNFFGERTLVARAVRDGVQGLAVADAERVDWWSTAGKHRPLDADLVHCIAKGRKLLRIFNL